MRYRYTHTEQYSQRQMHIKRWAAIPPRRRGAKRLRLREADTHGAETTKRQNERRRKKQRSTQRKKTNASNKKSHQEFLFCQKTLGVRLFC